MLFVDFKNRQKLKCRFLADPFTYASSITHPSEDRETGFLGYEQDGRTVPVKTLKEALLQDHSFAAVRFREAAEFSQQLEKAFKKNKRVVRLVFEGENGLDHMEVNAVVMEGDEGKVTIDLGQVSSWRPKGSGF